MKSSVLFCGVVVLCCIVCVGAQGNDGYRLARMSSYFITAPKKVHPNEVVQLSASILEMYYPEINVRASIRRGLEEMCSASTTFYTKGTQMMQMRLPINAESGHNYTLRVEGATDAGGVTGFIFENETNLIFDAKQLSVLVQLSKPLFRQGQKVMFRIMPVEKNLMSRSGSMDVYIIDATDTIVKRWLSMQTNAGGVLDMEFQLSEQPHYGEWKVAVNAFGFIYEKPFRVDEFWITAIDVNVSMPLYIMDDDFGLAGVFQANLSLGQVGKGTAKHKLEIWKAPGDRETEEDEEPIAVIHRDSQYFPGTGDFLFTMEDIEWEIQNVLGPEERVAGKELRVECEVYDWFLAQSATGAAISVIYSNDVDLRLLGDRSRVFKPNQKVDVYFAVVHKDGMPLRRERRQVTVTKTERSVTGQASTEEKKFLVGDNGIAYYTFVPMENSQRIDITAYYDTIQSRLVDLTMWRHYSPSDTFVYVVTSTVEPMADNYMVFTVTSTTLVPKINYVITAGGNIVTGNVLDMTSRQRTFSVALSRDMIPEAHLVVWYVKDDEVVADSVNFFVNGTRLNQVDVRFNRGKDFTGDTVEVNAWTDPSSYIGFSGIDYELWAYGWGTFITESQLIKELSTFDSLANTSFSHTWNLAEEQDQMIHYPAPNYGVDANQTFDYAGLIVFTDANVTRIWHTCNETLGFHPCMDGTCYEENQRCDGARDCQDGQDEMGCVYPSTDPHTPPRDRLGLVTRHYVMDGEWLWGGHFVMPNGRLDVITEVEDEPMSWVLGSYAISRELGFGIIHEPVRHQATRSFYMRAEAPELMVKGEMVGIRVGLFNYWDEDLECIVMLHDSPDYRFVIVEEFGIVSSYAPRTIRGDIQTMVFLEKGHVYEIQIPIIPVVDGCIHVSLSANAFIYGDNEDVTICTKYDGVTNHLHTPYFIDLISSGSLVLPDLEIPVPERFIKPEERQHLYVPGSPVATIGIVGDVVGPGFFEDFLTAENTLRKPYGGAEQNMYNFAYTLYNLKYLKESNQLDSDVLSAALDGMGLSLQRQLSYMNEDGSFSQFRDYQDFTPSTWASAFIIQGLNAAQERDWELNFFIPTDLLNRAMIWLCTRQNSDGAFFENAPLYDKKMRSNHTLINGIMKESNYALTAFVAIAMQKATRVTSQAEICRSNALGRARSYLENFFMSQPEDERDVFETSVCTYALHVMGSDKSTEAFMRMDNMKIEENYLYWADKPIPANDIKTVDTIPYYQPRRWYDNEGYGVAATGYALLTYLRRNKLSDSQPIMKWLQTMRNTFAGHSSTSDSIVALEALVEYAKKDTNRGLYNIEVVVQATSMGNFSQAVRLDKTNWPTQQNVDIDPVWGSVRGRAQGTGIALMQLDTSVNVEYPHQILPAAEDKFFDVDIIEYNYTGWNFSIMEVTPCARWARPDISNRSGLAVLEVHVPTGYIITNDVLRAYAQSGDVPTLRRAEAYDRKVVFYFDYLEHTQPTCVKFRMDRWFPVANMTIQHLLRVFDYYEPGMHNTTLYDTYNLFNLHMCQVCGSFQCPYCRYYNTASPTAAPPILFSGLIGTFMLILIQNSQNILQKLLYT